MVCTLVCIWFRSRGVEQWVWIKKSKRDGKKKQKSANIMANPPSTIFYADEIIASLLEMTVIWNIFIKWLKCAYYVWKHDIKILANEGLFDGYVGRLHYVFIHLQYSFFYNVRRRFMDNNIWYWETDLDDF